MTDAQIFELLDAMAGAPRIVEGNRQYVHLGHVIIEWRRIGKGQRWAFSPSRDVVPARELRAWWPRDVRLWAERALTLNVATHARAMGLRIL